MKEERCQAVKSVMQKSVCFQWDPCVSAVQVLRERRKLQEEETEQMKRKLEREVIDMERCNRERMLGIKKH